MSLALLAEVLAKRGISHRQSKADANFAKMSHYSRLKSKSKILIAEAESEYQSWFKRWYKKSH